MKVPRIIRDEDISSNIISFSHHCIEDQVLESDFPPRMNHKNHLECHSCKSNYFDCAFELFRNHSSSVVKLYSINSNVCSLVFVSISINDSISINNMAPIALKTTQFFSKVPK